MSEPCDTNGHAYSELTGRCGWCSEPRPSEETTLFYLSFADAKLPEGSQFLGAAIVRAQSFLEAVTASHDLGINPGGAVAGHRVMDPETMADMHVPVEFVGKLLQRPELDRLSNWAVGL